MASVVDRENAWAYAAYLALGSAYGFWKPVPVRATLEILQAPILMDIFNDMSGAGLSDLQKVTQEIDALLEATEAFRPGLIVLNETRHFRDLAQAYRRVLNAQLIVSDATLHELDARAQRLLQIYLTLEKKNPEVIRRSAHLVFQVLDLVVRQWLRHRTWDVATKRLDQLLDFFALYETAPLMEERIGFLLHNVSFLAHQLLDVSPRPNDEIGRRWVELTRLASKYKDSRGELDQRKYIVRLLNRIRAEAPEILASYSVKKDKPLKEVTSRGFPLPKSRRAILIGALGLGTASHAQALSDRPVDSQSEVSSLRQWPEVLLGLFNVIGELPTSHDLSLKKALRSAV